MSELPPSDGPPEVRVVHLDGAAFRALAEGDLAAAEAVGPVAFSDYLAGPECRGLWRRRSEQVEQDPASAGWVTGVVWDERRSVAVGAAGFHGAPDAEGMVEIGYRIDPAYRRRGYARAALEALLARADAEPGVRRVRVSIRPDNRPSSNLALQYGFQQVGEQWDDEDGLELVYERPASMGRMHLRTGKDSDLEAVGRVHWRSRAAAYADILDPEALGGGSAEALGAWWSERWKWERETHRLTVADQDGEIIGFTYVGPSETAGAVELYAIHVVPELVGTGVGRALMVNALEKLTEIGGERAVLWVLEENDRARRFYDRGGWMPDGETRVEAVSGQPVPQLRYSRKL